MLGIFASSEISLPVIFDSIFEHVEFSFLDIYAVHKYSSAVPFSLRRACAISIQDPHP